MSRDRKEKEKEEKEPRLNVPSKRIKAAHRAHNSAEGAKPMSLRSYANFLANQAGEESKEKLAAEAWMINKITN